MDGLSTEEPKTEAYGILDSNLRGYKNAKNTKHKNTIDN